ncbi:VOC family protein [Mesorhizobium sp. VK24D]|uniref:VOC family protein n=1 Tax=Mesorhizobium album TaxID=3072314 RepID=A0ABU4Y6V0_9HYPH|nr:VOC family protein [Mesorhizobium sp. VK24D]MDX8481820.1 VOC family protein [Mesorhizobium sp. VK24D]
MSASTSSLRPAWPWLTCPRHRRRRSSFHDRPSRHQRFRFRKVQGLLRQGDGAAGRFAALHGAGGIYRRRQGRRLWPRPAGVLAKCGQGEPKDHQHIAFTARSRTEVDAFHAAALAAGGKDNGGPGLRPHYHPNYYGAFVFDPDGNNVEAVCHDPE